MASKSGRRGMFLRQQERERLLHKVAKAETNAQRQFSAGPTSLQDEGCRVCRIDNDHANLLLCESCNEEYHLYCLNPPLQSVPIGEWYCDKCKKAYSKVFEQKQKHESDGLDYMVSALPPMFTERFGEIVWAQGGPGFGWWPSYVYDPRMTVGVARDLARKNLGRRHLVYFFQCHEAPFAVLPDNKILEWNEGLLENCHLGKVARHAGKNRSVMYEEALKVAIVELGKAIDNRMDWNHPDPIASLSPGKLTVTANIRSTNSGRKRGRSKQKKELLDTVADKVGQTELEAGTAVTLRPKAPTRINLQAALEIQNASMQLDAKLYCRIQFQDTNIGFIQLPVRRNSTFEDARTEILSQLEDELPASWKFQVPTLGPVSYKQESTLGPIFLFLQQASMDPNLGDGSSRHPMKIQIMERKLKEEVIESTDESV